MRSPSPMLIEPRIMPELAIDVLKPFDLAIHPNTIANAPVTIVMTKNDKMPSIMPAIA